MPHNEISTPKRGTAVRPRLRSLPAMRNYSYEHVLCTAIRNRFLVWVGYKQDPAAKLFEPHAVFCSTRSRYCLAALEVRDSETLQRASRITILEIGLLHLLEVTSHHFDPPADFDPQDPRYRNGISCSVAPDP